jgi:hypothetical protein
MTICQKSSANRQKPQLKIGAILIFGMRLSMNSTDKERHGSARCESLCTRYKIEKFNRLFQSELFFSSFLLCNVV